MRGSEADTDLPAFCQTDLEDRRPFSSRASHALRLPPWKYIESPEAGLVELYDLAADPAETANAAHRFGDARAGLAKALREWQDTTDRLELEPVELTPEARAALRALGYVQ
jgi:arylsulfatase A-like enzyme